MVIQFKHNGKILTGVLCYEQYDNHYNIVGIAGCGSADDIVLTVSCMYLWFFTKQYEVNFSDLIECSYESSKLIKNTLNYFKYRDNSKPRLVLGCSSCHSFSVNRSGGSDTK